MVREDNKKAEGANDENTYSLVLFLARIEASEREVSSDSMDKLVGSNCERAGELTAGDVVGSGVVVGICGGVKAVTAQLPAERAKATHSTTRR